MCEFRDEILLRGKSVNPVKNLNLNFSKKKGGKTVIYRNSPEKSCDFSRSRMTKQIASLESSGQI